MGPSADRSNPAGISVLLGIQIGGRRLESVVWPLGDKDCGVIESKLGFIVLLASMGQSTNPLSFFSQCFLIWSLYLLVNCALRCYVYASLVY